MSMTNYTSLLFWSIEDVQRGFTRTVAAVCDICGKEIPKGTHVLVIPRRNRDRVEDLLEELWHQGYHIVLTDKTEGP